MKYLLVVLVVVVVLWLLWRPKPGQAAGRGRTGTGRTRPAEMVACAHCDLRLPRADALFDPQGRPYCGDAHRRSGPR
ncbi:PP0621 family protein [Rubrivivax albus]|uniref:Preprotein translocase subunit YajC n=1 Tax=Rubrivivax albus TaxID=2499835 RepID=A0A3S2WVB1_9BURK|nr:PP0621 family protein [Rubrivivax albus]RVT52147.1 hypothetical protein ENE75_06685 [Rubrivivax albus]